MPISDITPEMMREIILDHYSNPLHKGRPADESLYEKTHADSTNCIDDFDLFLCFDGDKVVDALWDGVACAISTASTDILCDRLIGMGKKEALHLIEQFILMIEEKPFDEELMEEALAFRNTGKQAARIHCATMGWTAAEALIERKDKE